MHKGILKELILRSTPNKGTIPSYFKTQILLIKGKKVLMYDSKLIRVL